MAASPPEGGFFCAGECNKFFMQGTIYDITQLNFYL